MPILAWKELDNVISKTRLNMVQRVLAIVILFSVGFLGCPSSEAATRHEIADRLAEQADRYSRQRGNQFLAISYINKAINLQPKRADLYYQRAFILGRAGRYVHAINDFNRFVNSRKYSHAIRFRADCFMALGMFQKAVNDYMVFLRNAPKDGKVWSYLAEALFFMGRSDLALDATRKGLATGSHWSKRLSELRKKIMAGERITPHKPLSN